MAYIDLKLIGHGPHWFLMCGRHVYGTYTSEEAAWDALEHDALNPHHALAAIEAAAKRGARPARASMSWTVMRIYRITV